MTASTIEDRADELLLRGTRARSRTQRPGDRGDLGDSQALAPRLRALSLGELLELELPPREDVLAPWLPTQGLAMVYAPRGIGKTWVGLGVAYAVASGGSFLNWSAPAARGVVYVDGEMPAVVMQQRLAAVAASAALEPTAAFFILTPDIQTIGMPDIATEAGQGLIDEHVTDDIALIVVDNLSSLVRSGRENEAESWQLVQTWALRHRAAGRSVLFVHHAGKAGAQRGTSRREDVLDTVIALRRPADYKPESGAAFEVHFEKARGIHGDSVTPFEARLTTDAEGKQLWITRTLEDSTRERVAALVDGGLTQQEITAELGLAKSTVSHHVKALRESGRVS
jgi:DNA-binding CsgD family transcriptional regulator